MHICRQRFTTLLSLSNLVAYGSAGLLALAFPHANLPWLALPATAGLFWAWRRRNTWHEALGVGFVSGLIFFAITFSWFGETAGALIGPFAPLLTLGPAALSASAFAVTALGIWCSERWTPDAYLPLTTALLFTIAETLRSYGPLGNPFGSLSTTQVETPFAPLAAFGGATLITLAITLIGAAITEVLIDERRLRSSCVTIGLVILIVTLANIFAPARSLPPATYPVALVQGDIRQSLKWSPGALTEAIARYEGLTESLTEDETATTRARVILWPETVLPTDLAADTTLQRRLSRLAKQLDATLVVGALERAQDRPYNTLWFFGPHGENDHYRKRRLVPFAETLPGDALLHTIPLTQWISRFGAGTDPFVLTRDGRHLAPLICWESGFPDLLHDQMRHGADTVLLATDDAWFGNSAGPDQHAAFAQLRAIESGTWILRAAATGVTGIIAPNGLFTERAAFDTITVLRGKIGASVSTPFARVGPATICASMLILLALTLLIGYLRRERSSQIRR